MRSVKLWLWLIVALVAAMVLLGGATRLTGSGLSITEWRPVTGVLPPLSETAWLAEFDKYRAIPQFLAVNSGMTLAEFKFIFWWEWAHRLLGRLVGVVFLIPFLIFWWRGLFDRALTWKLGGIFVLGGIQGAIGWWMVQSGLVERTDVSQYRLAIHLTLAGVIIAAVVATVVTLEGKRQHPSRPRIRVLAILILVLTLAQFFLGALVAKTGAGLTFNTWPWIDGRFIPPADSLFAVVPLWKNFFENVLTVQFDHRMVAYVLFLIAGLHAFDMQRSGPLTAALRAVILFALVTVQAILGVLTLVQAVPIGLALAHQAGAIVILIVAVQHVALLPPQAERP